MISKSRVNPTKKGNDEVKRCTSWEEKPLESRYQISSWLYSLTPGTTTQKMIYATNSDALIPKVGVDILTAQAFRRWKEGKARYLNCHGILGSGKTMAATVAIDHLQRCQPDNRPVLYFFCDYATPSGLPVSLLLANLLGQIVESKGPSTAVCDLYNSRGGFEESALHSKILEAIEKECPLTHNSALEPFLVLDAVDGFILHAEKQNLFQHLEKLGIRVMMTSRSPITSAHAVTEHLNILSPDQDIDIYMSHRFRRGSWHNIRPELQKTIREKIQSDAKGMILIAKLRADVLQTYRCPSDIETALKKPPEGVLGSYCKPIMQRLQTCSAWAQEDLATLFTCHHYNFMDQVVQESSTKNACWPASTDAIEDKQDDEPNNHTNQIQRPTVQTHDHMINIPMTRTDVPTDGTSHSSTLPAHANMNNCFDHANISSTPPPFTSES